MGFSLRRVPTFKQRRCRYLVSTAGNPNFGDEFITAAWLRFLAKEEPESDVWLDCPNPGHAAILFGSIHPHLHTVNTLWQLVWNSSGEDIGQRAAQIETWIARLGSPREDLGILEAQKATSIHFLGGGHISQMWEAHSLLFAAAAAYKRRNTGLQLFGTGLGLTPLNGPARAVVEQASEVFDFLEVRDEESTGIAGIQGHDDAFLGLCFRAALPLETDVSQAGAYVVLQQDVIGRSPEALPIIIDILRSIKVNEAQAITLVEAIPPEDAWAATPLANLWPGGVNLMPFAQLWTEGLPFISDAVWVTSRFHMHLLGAAAGACGSVLDFNNQYYGTKHRSLFQEGTGWTHVSVSADGFGAHGDIRPAVNPHFPAKAAALAQQKLALATRLYRTGS